MTADPDAEGRLVPCPQWGKPGPTYTNDSGTYVDCCGAKRQPAAEGHDAAAVEAQPR